MTIPFLIILSHFFCDFILQTDKMAQGKSKSNYWLSMHVLTYCAGFIPFTLYTAIGEGLGNAAILWLLINGILHFCTDYITSRINSKLWADKKVHWFFVGVGADQVVHYGCLLFTYQYFING